ncbi:Na+/H+ antiporter subunit E [Maledivibacter halophilus]|uniref:Multisubunit sodium/proton antiporter, MrpE subunit n=1 Tax=Maledivibacter halophilus TaxID=36842 RepID=A0A1T5ML59_9FIRM|nr:Na+/H+ antiporter subunit E [Maledivibacter halophilus]SKC88926.1 multisubunit sodium/proton antiporter, MrpE subunit [Maledivibacter halophilus]
MKLKEVFFKVLVLYLIIWTILAEKVDYQVIIIGIFIAFLISMYNYKIKYRDYKGNCFLKFRNLKLFVNYLFLLIKEIIIANIQLAIIVLSRKIVISPNIIKFNTKLKSDFLKMILANSITLTPGTLTIEIDDDEFTVHCITKDQASDVIDSKFEKLLLKIEEQL